jgi:hypothetical protein
MRAHFHARLRRLIRHFSCLPLSPLMNWLKPRRPARPGRSEWSTEPSTDARASWSDSEWARIRAPARSRDEALSPKAHLWLGWLPEDVRPHTLAARYPRIVNQLALCWRDVGLTEHLLGELIVDRRGDREGFAAPIADEIVALYGLHALRTDPVDEPAESRQVSTQH